MKLFHKIIISAFVATSVWNNFISARENLPEIISWMFSNMFNVVEKIMK